MKKIYCVGGATIDKKLKIIFDLKTATSNPVTSITTYGGVARNVAENLAQWTNEIYLQSIVADDAEGLALLQHLKHLGINTTACDILKKHRTAHYYAVLEANGELHNAFADMEIFSYANLNNIKNCWKAWPTEQIIFLDTNLPVDIINATIETHAHHMQLCIDPVSIAKAKKLPEKLSHVFLFKPNQQEAQALTGITINSIADSKKAGLHLLKKEIKNVVISLGKEGYTVVNQDYQQHFPVKSTPVIHDANGAGDAFMSGILFGLQQNSDLRHACELGAAAACFALQSTHSVVKNISAQELYASLKQGHPHATIF